MNRRLIFAVLALLCAGAVSAQERTEAPAASSEVRYVGRTQTNGDDVSFDWSGTCFECRLRAARWRCAFRIRKKLLQSDRRRPRRRCRYNVRDGFGRGAGREAGARRTYRADAETHRGEQGRTTIHAFLLDRGRRLLPAAPAPGRHIEFIGNSLTCGYGTEGLSKDEPFKPQTENCNKAYACIIARYFGADYTLIAHFGTRCGTQLRR